jgi:signal transduction histidine kinase
MNTAGAGQAIHQYRQIFAIMCATFFSKIWLSHLHKLPLHQGITLFKVLCFSILMNVWVGGVHASTSTQVPAQGVASAHIQVFNKPPLNSRVLQLDGDIATYQLNSAENALGFVAAPDGLMITDAKHYLNSATGLINHTRPSFWKNHRQWMRVKVSNTSQVTDWVLVIHHFLIRRVNILIDDGTNITQITSDLATLSNTVEASNRTQSTVLDALGRGVPITLKPNTDYTLFFELYAKNNPRPPYIGLMQANEYYKWAAITDALFKLALGIILGLILFAFIGALVLKSPTFFWFGVSGCLLMFFNTLRSHVINQFFTPVFQLPWWIWVLASATLLSFLYFARAFLSLKIENTSLHKLFNLAIGVTLVALLISPFLPKTWNILIFSLTSVVVVSMIAFAGVYKIYKQGSYYLIFMLGWLPLIYSVIDTVTHGMGTPEVGDSTLSYKNLQEPYLQVLHMLIHLIAILLHVLDLKKQAYFAEQSNRAKSEFLASVSHDLKQPLNTLGLFLDHLAEHVTSSGQTVLAKVNQAHASMNYSFSALMDISQLEAGAVTVNNQSVHLRLVLQKMHNEFCYQAKAKGLVLSYRKTSCDVYTDPVLLERILKNLLSNAIKYTDTGKVVINIITTDAHTKIQIWDTGIGINPAEQASIFDLYQRGKATSHKIEGTGIGLTTVKYLVDLLGYQIQLKSTVGKGSMFELSIPSANNAALTTDHNLVANTGANKGSNIATNASATTAKDRNLKTIYQPAPKLAVILAIKQQSLAQSVTQSLNKWAYPILTDLT